MKSHDQVMLRQFVLRNDADAFAALSNQYASLVYGVCWRILRDEHKAADAAQETFLQLLRQAHKIHGSVAAWLHRVATGKAIDIIRKDKRQREHLQSFQASLDDSQEDWAQLSMCIDEALNQLDAQSREIIIEHYLENRTTREIAGRKGLSQATVSRKANAALQSLRNTLKVPGLVVTPAVMSSMFAESSAQAIPVTLVQVMGKMALAGHQASLGFIAKASYMVRGLNLLPKVALAAAMVTIIGGNVLLQRQKHFNRTTEISETVPVRTQAVEAIEDPKDRTVVGLVVDPNGQPLPQIPIVTYGYHKRETVTGHDGRFAFKLPLNYYHEAGCLIVA